MPPSSAAASSALSERPSTATRRTGVGERAREPAPDPAAAARDERAAAGQVEGTGHGAGVARAELGEDPRRLAIGLLDELDHPVGLRHPLELHRHGARVAGVEDRLQVLLDRRHAAAGRHVAVHLAVAVGDVHVADHPRQHGDVVERRAGEMQVRDVGIRLDGGMVDLADQVGELVHAVRDRVLERLELDRQLDSLRLGVLGELAEVLGDEPEDLLLREHLEVAVVLADDEQHVAAAEVRLLVDVRLAAVEREAAHGRHEVDEAERDADGRADRQPELLAGLLDLAALVVARRQRILEDVVGVEADLLRLRDPLEHAQRRPVPGRADQPELEGVLHQLATCAARAAARSSVPDGRKSSVSKRLRSPRCRPMKYSIGRPSSRYVTPLKARIGRLLRARRGAARPRRSPRVPRSRASRGGA